MITQTQNTVELSTTVMSFLAYVDRATPSDIEQASVWYRDAEEIAEDVAENLDSSLEVGASVVSAFSPRERWSTNVAKAIEFSLGGTPKGLGNNLKMARESTVLGFSALKGDKTNAFARAIAGDHDAVVIDVWMIKAAGLDHKKGVNKTQYRELADAVREVATLRGLTPRTCQALIWIVIRGSAS